MQEWFLVVIVSAIIGLLVWLLVLWILESRTPRIICLMYHRFASSKDYAGKKGTERIYTVSADNFERQIAYLEENGYTFLTPQQVRYFTTGELKLPQPSVLITIDDGCASIKAHALPVLRRYQARATCFVTTDPHSPVFHLPGVHDERLSDTDLKDLDGDIINIESHTVSHRPLRGLSEEQMRYELADSRAKLEQILNRKIEYLAIPGNWYDKSVMNMARETGYQAVWYSNPGTVQAGADLFGLPRVNVEGQLTLDQFIRLLRPWGVAKRRFLAGIKRIPGRILRPRYWLPLRKIILRCIPGQHLSMGRMLVLAGILAVLMAVMIILLLFWL